MKKGKYIIAAVLILIAAALLCSGFLNNSLEVEAVKVEQEYIKDSFTENAVVKREKQ